jgi:hypothetical protein
MDWRGSKVKNLYFDILKGTQQLLRMRSHCFKSLNEVQNRNCYANKMNSKNSFPFYGMHFPLE